MKLNYNYNFFNTTETPANKCVQTPNALGIGQVVPKFDPNKTMYYGTNKENSVFKN